MGLRVIASDLDGTFLTPDGLVTDLNRRAVLEAREAGVRFVVATGRPVRWLGVLDDLADADPLVVCSNGAMLYDVGRHEVLLRRGMPAGSVAEIAADLRRAIPGVRFALERGDLFGCESGTPLLGAREPGTIEAGLDELLDRVNPVVKLLVVHPTLCSDDLIADAEAVVGARAVVTHSLMHDRFGMLELSAPGVTKAALLAEVCGSVGVAAEDVVAFGDMPNDLAMLRWAGRGLVTADAHRTLREEFDTVGSNADSGVGRAILALLGR